MLIALVRGSKSMPVLQLLKNKFDAPEGAPVSKQMEGFSFPSKSREMTVSA